MALDMVKLKVETRSEFGKGASRRARRDGKIPAVVYGHGTDPLHLLLPAHDTLLALRNPNQLLELSEGSKKIMALPVDIQRAILKNEIEHVDLQIVRKGERIVVDVWVEVEGEVAPGNEHILEANSVSVEADALDLPDAITVNIDGREAGDHVYAKDLVLPEGVELQIEDDDVILTVDEITKQDLGDEPEVEEEAEADEETEEEDAE